MRKGSWTKKEEDFLRWNYGYKATSEIARILNRPHKNVTLKASRMNLKSVAQREYAVYSDDEFLFTGTQQECAERLDIKLESFRHYTTPTGRNRADTGMFVVDLGMWRFDEQ